MEYHVWIERPEDACAWGATVTGNHSVAAGEAEAFGGMGCRTGREQSVGQLVSLHGIPYPSEVHKFAIGTIPVCGCAEDATYSSRPKFLQDFIHVSTRLLGARV